MTYLVLLALIAWSVRRQLVAKPIAPLTEELRKPALFCAVGAGCLAVWPGGSDPVGVLALSLALSVVLGVARGLLMPVYRREGVPWRKGNATTIALWAALVAGKVALAFATGVAHPPSFGEVLVFLGVSIGVQSAVTVARAEPARATVG